MVPCSRGVRPRNGGDLGAWRSVKLHGQEEIIPAIDTIVHALEAADYSPKDTFAVRLALEEALVNAIKHGHKGDRSKEVHLRYQLSPERILLEIEDQGTGFRMQDVPDPTAPENLERSCGRGLLLMRSYMMWVRYNRAGNRVSMCRSRRTE
jgi:serine/threonine-protein kinase RsbW